MLVIAGVNCVLDYLIVTEWTDSLKPSFILKIDEWKEKNKGLERNIFDV